MASKGAVHMLTKALATEWAKSGVRVNALAPGYIATDMTLKMRERPELFSVWLDMTPMGRLGSRARSRRDGLSGLRAPATSPAPYFDRWRLYLLVTSQIPEFFMLSAAAKKKRQSIIDACLEMNALGINQGTSGNISLRDGDGLLITPTSMPYSSMTPEDIVEMDFDGHIIGEGRPSSEWRFHLDILRARPEADAIVHAHPTYCTTLSIMERSIPPIHYMIAVAGGDSIRCAPYAGFGTKELSVHAVEALQKRRACLLAHHGMIAIGDSLSYAMWLAVEVETLARQYVNCLQIGEPPLLSSEEIESVMNRMAGYGHKVRV